MTDGTKNSLIVVSYSQEKRLGDAALGLIDIPCQKLLLRDWTPTGYLTRLLELPGDWVVHIDEDCFVTAPSRILDIIDHMRENNFVCCGMPDGGVVKTRRHNPVACNPFFLVLNVAELREVVAEDPDINAAIWDESYQGRVAPFVGVRGNRYLFDEFEPYYPLFFWLCRNDKRILYLDAREWALEPEGQSTELLDHCGAPLAVHTWYARQYKVPRPSAARLLRAALAQMVRFVLPRPKGAHFDRIERALELVRRIRAAESPVPRR
jgi:hypothetical protein